MFISHDILLETLALSSINKTHIKISLLDGFQKVFIQGESLWNEGFALGFHKDPVLLNLTNDLQVNVKSLLLKFEDDTKMIDF